MYLNGMGFRGIARVTNIDHSTIMSWVSEAGAQLSDELSDTEEIPEIPEIDELLNIYTFQSLTTNNSG